MSIKNSHNYYIYFAILATAGCIGFYAFWFWNSQVSDNPGDWGQFGDYFGGILNPIIAIFAVHAAAKALHKQEQEFRLLKEQVEEQKEEIEMQRVESRFFQLMKTYHDNIQRIVLPEEKSVVKGGVANLETVYITGKNAMTKIYGEIRKMIIEIDKEVESSNDMDDEEFRCLEINRIYSERFIETYFDNLINYHHGVLPVLKYLTELKANNGKLRNVESLIETFTSQMMDNEAMLLVFISFSGYPGVNNEKYLGELDLINVSLEYAQTKSPSYKALYKSKFPNTISF